MAEHSLKKNFVWAFLGNGFAAFCMWLLVVVLTKLGRPEDVGLYAVASAVGLPVSMLLSLKLHLVQVTDARQEYTFGHYMALKLITAVLTIIATCVIGYLFYPPQTARVIAVFGIGYGLIAFREVFLAVMQKSERMDKAAVSRFIQSVLSVLFFGGLFYATQSMTLSALGLVMARLMGFVFYDIPVCRALLKRGSAQQEIVPTGMRPCWQPRVLIRLTVIAVPLGIVAWLGTLFTSVPRLTMDVVMGKEQLGYFAAISSLLVVGNLFMGALAQTASPRLSRYFIECPKGYLMLVMKLLALSLALGLAGIAVSVFYGRQILTLLFTAEYAVYSGLFVWVMTAAAILFVFSGLNIALTAARCFKSQVPIYAASAAVAAGVSFYAIPRYGMTGGAWALLACYSVGVICCLGYLVYIYRKQVQNF